MVNVLSVISRIMAGVIVRRGSLILFVIREDENAGHVCPMAFVLTKTERRNSVSMAPVRDARLLGTGGAVMQQVTRFVWLASACRATSTITAVRA